MRPALEFIKQRIWEKTAPNHPVVGVEVGVYYGENAKNIIEGMPENIRTLHLVDPYIQYDERQVPIIGDIAKETAIENLKPYQSLIQWHYKSSVEAAKEIRDLYFVYLDADHRYGATMADLEAWWPTVRSGGVIAGDDWRSYASVREAVIDFAYIKGLTIMFNDNDWWFVKP